MDLNLYGSFDYNIDDKGRISVPAQFRHAYKTDLSSSGELVVLTRGLDTCIFGFPVEVWDEYVEKLPYLKMESKAQLRFTRSLHRHTANCNIDQQGRMKIPQQLLDYAKLTREAVVVGVKNRFEIWDPVILKAYEEAAEDAHEYSEEEAMTELYVTMDLKAGIKPADPGDNTPSNSDVKP